MSQSSRCIRCDAMVWAHDFDGGHAFYQCKCGRRWNTREYYGRETKVDHGGYWGRGALIGGAMGGIGGAFVGAIAGNFFRDEEDLTSECIVCGGTAHPTGSRGSRVGFQCSSCFRVWTERH
jgi:hypothetical protein